MALSDEFTSPGNPPPYTAYPGPATAIANPGAPTAPAYPGPPTTTAYPGPPTAIAYPGPSTTTAYNGSATAPAYPGPTTVQPAPQMVGVAGSGPVIVSMMPGQPMGPDSVLMVCKTCGVQIMTRLELKSTTKTHVCAGLLCLFGCWPCVLIPYFTSTCQNANHYCPHCTAYIGTYVN